MKSEVRLNRVLLFIILSHQCEMMNRPNSAFMFFVFAIIELVVAVFTGIKEDS